MEARSCAQQLSRQEGGSGIFNFEKSGEGHGAGAFELGGWVGVCPGVLHKPSSHFACMACAESRLECRPNTPPTSLFLYLSLSLFVTNITARRRFGKQRECVTLVLSLCFGSLNHTKKIKNSSGVCVARWEGCIPSAFINKIFISMFVNMAKTKQKKRTHGTFISG